MTATAASRVIWPARQSTSASQNVVRPTANPTTPGTVAAVSSQERTVRAFSPRPSTMQSTVSRPPWRAGSDQLLVIASDVAAFNLPDTGLDACRLKFSDSLHREAG